MYCTVDNMSSISKRIPQNKHWQKT